MSQENVERTDDKWVPLFAAAAHEAAKVSEWAMSQENVEARRHHRELHAGTNAQIGRRDSRAWWIHGIRPKAGIARLAHHSARGVPSGVPY
jgi:hypothetical protein